ncbi:MAG: hypothetical protein WC956_08245 [bacterium]
MGEMQIQAYIIPYDVDSVADGGCGGRDLWSDRYGTEVLLLTGSQGSAYLCPTKSSDWRIYVDHNGHPWVPLSWMADSWGHADYRLKDAISVYQSVLKCGIERLPDKVPLFSSMIDGTFFSNPIILPALDGVCIPLKENRELCWKNGLVSLKMYDGRFDWRRLFGNPLSEHGTDSAGLMWDRYRVYLAYDPEFATFCPTDGVELAPVSSREEDRDQDCYAATWLREQGSQVNAADRLYVDAAVATFDRAWKRNREFFRFEEYCLNYQRHGASKKKL